MATLLSNDPAFNKSNGFGRNSGSSQNKSAQSIQETSTLLGIAQVQVRLEKTASPTDNAVIQLQTDTAGVPSGTVLASGSIAAASIVSDALATITLNVAVDFTANTKYWIVFTRSGSTDDTNYYQVVGTSTDTYANGASYYLSSGSWSLSTGDNTDTNFILLSIDAVIKNLTLLGVG